ncbi:UbiA-like polyprenyltransferase [Silvibacterium dinghuense]|uniref:4-hydroxybenzoate polyprenyltransferase n=1 Tax=Silvibacterium dinghuense TaxID=1560006 RepID=A0A4Q1SDM3_9BACT|nr:UbiA-like polyprenyltransferase [Silvibacterium dinghuense]RXS95336.1 4-hydroxybenzoate octaprenyltransferase [Silvibacterium dinghuense]
MAFFRNVRVTLEMIKWEHSIFALPFALTGAMLAARGIPHVQQLAWIIVCMVTARSAAMAFNRWADSDIDATNPRTAMRAIPAGLLSRSFVGGFTLVMAALFVLAASQLNRLTLLLSPLVLLVVLSYSYMKRLTRWSHVVLGIALGIAPSAAWIAVRGSLDTRIILLTAAVMLWVAGFDVLYSCQDVEHDRKEGLFSVPSTFGVTAAFWIARLMHVAMLALLIVLAHAFALGPVAYVGIAAVAVLLCYEHLIISPGDLRRMNAAFFTMNGVISVVYFLFVAADLMLHR